MKFDMAAFDLDGVIVAERSSWEWVHRHFGVDNTESLAAYCSGRIDDREFMRTDIAMWMRKDPEVSLEKIRGILMGAQIVKGAKEAVASLRESGVRTCIVSGGIDLLAEHIGRVCGVEKVMSNGLTADVNGRLLGDGILRVELRDKASALKSIMGDFGVRPERCAAIGNSWVDVSMFRIAGYGIAFNPIDEQTVREADIVIQSDDLRDILPCFV